MSNEAETVAVFEVGGRACAMSASAVAEVILLPELLRPPGLPGLLEGVMDLGGTAVPVLRLDRLFGFDEIKAGLYTPLLLLRDADPMVALMVDAVRGVLHPEQVTFARAVEGDLFNDCVAGEIHLGDETIHLLDPERILLAEEKLRVAEFRDLAQKRLLSWEPGGEAKA